MTNAELADEIERHLRDGFLYKIHLGKKEYEQIIAALRQSSDKVLVPREPTEAMLEAAQESRGLDGILLNDIDVWAAMLAAAEADLKGK